MGESRDGAHEAGRERTARSAWCGKHRRKAPPDVLTGRSAQACLSREVPTDHEARGQGSKRLRKERERSCRVLLSVGGMYTQRPRRTTKHDDIHTQAVCQSRMTTWTLSNAVLVSPVDLAQHVSEHAVRKRTVRDEAALGAP